MCNKKHLILSIQRSILNLKNLRFLFFIPILLMDVILPILLINSYKTNGVSEEFLVDIQQYCFMILPISSICWSIFSMKDYVGGTVTIRENYIETNLPLGRWKLKNPIYKLEKQNEEDFWEYSHANIHSGFGFKSEKIKAVTVFDDKDEWDEFGNIFWIRDKDHLIFFGPVYFLAKRIE